MISDPLDILLPPAAELLAKTAAFLDGAGIVHGELLLQADVSQNAAITDREHVFVKVYRRKDGLQEPRNTMLAVAYGASTPKLLATTSWCSVWEYLPLTPLPLDSLSSILSNVREVHERTRGLDLIEVMDYDQAFQVVEGRLRKVAANPLAPVIEAACRETCDHLAAATAQEEVVFIHADLQLKNMGMTPRGPVIFDWEICKMAPVELELSKLEENLFTANLWTLSEVEELYGAPLDRDLLTMATRLRYLQNIAFHLEREEEGIAQRQYSALGRFERAVAV